MTIITDVLGTRAGVLRFPEQAAAAVRAKSLTGLINGYASSDWTRAIALQYPNETATIISTDVVGAAVGTAIVGSTNIVG